MYIIRWEKKFYFYTQFLRFSFSALSVRFYNSKIFLFLFSFPFFYPFFLHIRWHIQTGKLNDAIFIFFLWKIGFPLRNNIFIFIPFTLLL